MKLFKVTVYHRYTWGCCNSVVVAAADEKRALELARKEQGREEDKVWDEAKVEDLSLVENEGIICVDFTAA